MTLHELWSTWKGITALIISTGAAVAAVYGLVIWVDNYVYSELQASDFSEEQHAKQMMESYNREQGDLEIQLELLHFRLTYFDSESEYRQLSDREKRLMALVQAEITILEARISRIQCIQDPSRDPILC